MKLVFIVGASATGKMTVGQELQKITDLGLFYNHQTIEPVLDVFGYFNAPLILKLRYAFIEEYAMSGAYGLIHTMVWNFDSEADKRYVDRLVGMCIDVCEDDVDIYVIELHTDLEERVNRNKTSNRINHKPSKRNIGESEKRLLADDLKTRTVSTKGEVGYPNHLVIDNTNLSAKEVAELIKDKFSL